ncbi:MAG: sigma-70 family RNA polymerase sigma factor [Muribaculaceae bacterium]|nr:sigma-70 family RNA polymerase sigma factor [Muribaculaceae bacterium]
MPVVPFIIDDKFLSDARDKALRFALNHYSDWASNDECEDLVQEAMMTMYNRVHEGTLTELTSNLSTLVIGFVKNIAKKKKSKQSTIATAMPFSQDEDDVPDPVAIARAREAVSRWHDTENDTESAQLQNAVLDIVEHMTEPCRSILWAYYWEGKTMKEIAEELNYSGKDVAKSQKSRCMTKLKTAMEEIRNQLRS